MESKPTNLAIASHINKEKTTKQAYINSLASLPPLDSSYHQNMENEIITICDSDTSIFQISNASSTSYHPINTTIANTSINTTKRKKLNESIIDMQTSIKDAPQPNSSFKNTTLLAANCSDNSSTLSNITNGANTQVANVINKPLLSSTKVSVNPLPIITAPNTTDTNTNTNINNTQSNHTIPHSSSTFTINILEPYVEPHKDTSKNITKNILYDGVMPLTEYNIQLYPNMVPGGFVNMTTYFVPIEVQTLLSFGPKYCPIRIPEIYDYYQLVKRYHDDHLDSFVNLSFCNPLEMEMHYNKVLDIIAKEQNLSSIQKSLKQLYQYAINYLNKHKDVLIVQSDKCKSTVLMNRADYIDKMDNWITSYINSGSCRVEKEKPEILIRHIGGYYRKLVRPLCKLYEKNTGIFPRDIYVEIQQLLSKEPTLPYLYGTIKTHKDDASIRPICSPIGWYISPIHKLVQHILKYTLDDRLSSHNINDTNHLTGHLLGLRPIPNYVLISIDIKEMYPSTQIFPLMQTLQNLMQLPWFVSRCPIPIDLLKQSINFILLQGNYFTFNDKCYQQIEGLPQGGSASGLLATIYIDSKLEIYTKSLVTPYRIHAWWKYVDDMLVYLPLTCVEPYCEALSKILGYKITYEIEHINPLYNDHSCITYLDYTIIHTKDSFKLALHRKPKLSQRICHYTSHIPFPIKKATVLYYLRRIVYRTSMEYLQQDLLECVDQILQNGYPLLMIMHTLQALILKYPCVSSPYIQHSSLARLHLLNQFIQPYLLQSKTLYPHLTHKSPVPKQYNKSLVYSCEEMSYFLRTALQSLSVEPPTFCRSDTLFTLLHMSLRSISPNKTLTPKHRILLTTCVDCGIGFLCTGKGIPHEIIEDVLKDPLSPLYKHSTTYKHIISPRPLELPYMTKTSPTEQLQIYKTIYVSMGMDWDPKQNYNLLPRFIAHSLDAYIQRFKPSLPRHKRRRPGDNILTIPHED